MNRALSISASHPAFAWWLGLFVLGAALALAPPVPEPALYRIFIDQRELAGIPFFWNVVSNLPLLAVGAWGLYVVARVDARAFVEPAEKWSYAVCFAAVAFAGIGSTYFHLAPDADRLMWDRLPIALGFMALLAGVIGDRLGPQAGLRALGPLLVAGAASVFYWRWSMLRGAENIVPYAIVQYGALAAIMMHGALASRYSRRLDLFVVAAIYGGAKLAEMLDGAIYAMGGIVSGHTLKHVLAAIAVGWLVRMLQLRRPLSLPSSGRPTR